MAGSTESSVSLTRFRFHGLRKLNWLERVRENYVEHMARSGLDRWLEPGPFAILVGPNAGGKSTVIDLMRALGDASLWPSLARENYPGADFSGFDVEGRDFCLSVRFSKYTPDAGETFDKVVVFAVATGPGGQGTTTVLASRYDLDGDWVDPLREVLDVCAVRRPAYLEPFGGRPAERLSDQELVEALNALSPHFPSVMANPMVKPFTRFQGKAAGEGRIVVLFKDDPSQHAFVHRRALPLGWLQLAEVWSFLRRCEPGCLVVLDEPDRHLHPSLQRVMLEVVAEGRLRLDFQVVLATHSSVLTNPYLCSRVGAKAFVAARGRCEPLTDARRVLDDLGVTSGDLVQANGLIWVEGPSDRLYVKAWLDRRSASRGEAPWVERVHYAFVPYGALMKHLTLSDGLDDKLDVRAVNRNFVVVMDRDLDGAGLVGMRGEKGRLIAEAEALGADEHVWVTEGYTIEAYLPGDWPPVARYVTLKGGRLRVRGISKVALAGRFVSDACDWERSHREGSDIPARIAALSNQIRRWQTPPEDIQAAHFPPFLEEQGP